MRAQRRIEPTPARRSPRSTRAITQEFFSDAEVAIKLGVSPSYIRKLRREGKLPFVAIGRSVRIDARALQAFVDGLRGGAQ